MKSRTFRTCQNILRNLVEKYGPSGRVHFLHVKRAIIEEAGGDPRTIERYREHLRLLGFLKPHRDATFSLNWEKLDFKQLRLHESLIVEEEEEPP